MTIYDIAKRAGVSASTDSRVVNHRAGISEATRRKIEAILEETGFAIDEGARGLVSQKSRMVGILVSDIRNQHHIEGAWLVCRRLQEKGYVSILLNAGESGAEKAECVRILSTRKVDALVLVGSAFQCREVEASLGRYMPDVPVVFQNGVFSLGNVHSAVAAEDRGSRAAVEHLASSGRRRIAYINNTDTPSNRKKIEGYRSAISSHGLDEIIIPSCADSMEGGMAAASALLDGHSGIDAMLCSVDIVAAGACRLILERGMRIPEDIAVIGTDDSPYATIASPQLSSIDTRLGTLSDLCSDMLIALLEGRGAEKLVTVEPQLVVRQTG